MMSRVLAEALRMSSLGRAETSPVDLSACGSSRAAALCVRSIPYRVLRTFGITSAQRCIRVALSGDNRRIILDTELPRENTAPNYSR